MKKLLKEILQDLRQGKNLETYITLTISIVVAVLGLFQIVSFEIVGATILASLSILLYSALSNRKSIQKMEKTFIGNTSISPLIMPNGYPNLDNEFQIAKSVSILGTNLTSTIVRYHPIFRDILEKGKTIRYIMPESTPEIVRMLTFRSSSSPTFDAMSNAIEVSSSWIGSLAKFAQNPNQLQLRTIPYIMSFGLVIIEREDNSHKVLVKLMSYKDSRFPCFQLAGQTDVYWSDFFIEQYNALWEKAKEEPIPSQ